MNVTRLRVQIRTNSGDMDQMIDVQCGRLMGNIQRTKLMHRLEGLRLAILYVS